VSLLTAAALSVLLAQDPGYVRLSALNEDQVTHCLWWPSAPVVVSPEQNGSPEVQGETEFAALARALQTWRVEFDRCGSLPVSEGPPTSERWVGFNLKSPADTQNTVLYRQQGACRQVVPQSDPCWEDSIFVCANRHDCWPHQAGAFAITTNTFDGENGRIFDSDVELNDAAFRFTATVETSPICSPPGFEGCVGYDVENILAHEFGHVFGLDHAPFNPESTMYPEAGLGSTFMRDLDPASAQFVCDVYPAGQYPRDCTLERLELDRGRSHCGTVGFVPGLGVLWAAWRRRRNRSRRG